MTLLIMNIRGVPLKEEELVSRLVCFGANGINTFQGFKSRVIFQIYYQYVSFITNVHCMVHCTNLVTQTLFNLFLMSCIETCLQILCVYFNHSIERQLEFTKMVKNMDTKGNNILWNIKTMKISMINHVKHVLFKYQPLLMKMTLNATTIASPTSNLCFLIYVKTLLGLNAIMAFMEAIHSLIKFAQVA
jgi:hypothetical protein